MLPNWPVEFGRDTALCSTKSVNVSRISSCTGAYGPRRWTGPVPPCRGDRPAAPGVDCYCPSDDCGTVDQTSPTAGPILPPWKVLPWPRPVGPAPVRTAVAVAVASVKAPLGSADVSGVGRTLDLFV